MSSAKELSTKRKALLFIAGTLACLVFLPDLINYRIKNPVRTHEMTELTQRMKTVCIGRHLLEVPASAETAIGDSKIEFIWIERAATSLTYSEFETKMQEHEKLLRLAFHETEGTRLRPQFSKNDRTTRLFVSRENERATMMNEVEAFAFVDPGVWRLHYQTANERVVEVAALATELASKISLRSADEIPTSDGACIAGGLVRRKPKESERFSGGARDRSLSWTLTFVSDTLGTYPPEERLFARVDRAIDSAGIGAGIKRLRRATLKVAGRSAQEYVALYKENGVTIFDAKLETYGDQSPLSPMVKLSLEVGWPDQANPEDPRKFLNQEQALELWDAIVKSVRIRPGAF